MHELPPILVAEDDDDHFFLLRRTIRDAKLQNPVLRFRDGAELIKFLAQIPSSEIGPAHGSGWLLLLDITMPIMNGFEVLAWLAAHPELPKLCPIVLSASYRPEDVQRAFDAGALDYLVKPIAPELLAVIAEKQLSPSIP